MNQVDRRSPSQRAADWVTEFSGSWRFIGWFGAGCIVWVIAGACGVGIDPMPFLLLNWILTVVSTFQSPIILMSQNRQNEMDREHVQQILSEIRELRSVVDRRLPERR